MATDKRDIARILLHAGIVPGHPEWEAWAAHFRSKERASRWLANGLTVNR